MNTNKIRRDYQEKWIQHVFEVSAKRLKEVRHQMMLQDLEKVMDEIINEGEENESK